MPPKVDKRKRKGQKTKTKADRKQAKGNRTKRSKKDETPAKRKQVSSSSSSPRPSASSATSDRTPRSRKAKPNDAAPSPAATPDNWSPSSSFKLAATILSGCYHGRWFRLTPDPNKRDDISIASRQSWKNILPTFIEAGLYGTREVGDSGTEFRLEIRMHEWERMKTYLKDICCTKLEVTPTTPRRGRKSWYVILSDADKTRPHKYSSPILQQQSLKGEPVVSDRMSRSRKGDDDGVKSQLDALRKNIESKNLLHRMKEADTTIWDAVVEAAGKMGSLKSDLLKSTSAVDVSDVNVNDPGVEEAVTAVRDGVEKQIDDALALDFSITIHNSHLRPSRVGNEGIEVHKRKQANERMRSCAVFLAELWGFSDGSKTYEERQKIAKAVCNQIAYDHGYPKSTGASMLGKWRDQAVRGISTGNATAMSRSFSCRVSYTDRIERDHPGYLHEMYRYAIRTRGILATFSEIAETMNNKSATQDEDRPTLTLHRLQVYRWFKKNKGKELSAKEKPILTDDLKRQRVEWVRKWGENFQNKDTPVCYLDEKWFYTTSRRRKIKYLPPGPGERENDALVVRPKIRSRRFPVKVMYLGVVARPLKDEDKGIDFNGRIELKRVSRTKKVTKRTKTKKFSPDVKVNDEIGKQGRWRDLYAEGMTAEELFDIVSEYYDLSELVTERLELIYVSNEQAATKPEKRVSGDVDLSSLKKKDASGTQVGVTIADLDLVVRYQIGDEIEEDVNCDSKWMSDNMDGIGKKIREAYHWLKDEDVIYLVMDNAGGHGTDECVQKYTERLATKYNIVVVQQVARSPETNVLDLGIWMSLQSAVEKKHKGRCCNSETLNKTVMEVWKDVASVEAFNKVFGKLPMIYQLISRNRGGNDLVETNRGKKGIAETFGDANQEEFDAQPPLFPAHDIDEGKEADDGDDTGADDGTCNNDTPEGLDQYIDYTQGGILEDDVEDGGEDDTDIATYI